MTPKGPRLPAALQTALWMATPLTLLEESRRRYGSTILFDGFLKLYREDVDDPGEDEEGGRLPALAERDALARGKVVPAQHFTEPPPRFSEAMKPWDLSAVAEYDPRFLSGFEAEGYTVPLADGHGAARQLPCPRSWSGS